MGTNWYLVKQEMVPDILDDKLSTPDDSWTRLSNAPDTGILHIGKSSGGWRFSLHIIPDQGIHDFKDWLVLATDPDWTIMDEYGRIFDYVALIKVVAYRQPMSGRELKYHDIDGVRCVGHGSGTWDLITGIFS